MNNNIRIENETLRNTIMFLLDKEENEFKIEELNKIESLTIDYNETREDKLPFFIDMLSIFKNLKSLNIKNAFIQNEDIKILLELKELNEVLLEKCSFENADLIASLPLKTLSLINCEINEYKFINVMDNLEHLSIISGKLSIERINKIKSLKLLQCSYSKIEDISTKLDLPHLEELHIDNTGIKDLTMIKNLEKLKILSIDEDQYQKNIEVIKELKNKNVEIWNERMVKFGSEIDEQYQI